MNYSTNVLEYARTIVQMFYSTNELQYKRTITHFEFFALKFFR